MHKYNFDLSLRADKALCTDPGLGTMDINHLWGKMKLNCTYCWTLGSCPVHLLYAVNS